MKSKIFENVAIISLTILMLLLFLFFRGLSVVKTPSKSDLVKSFLNYRLDAPINSFVADVGRYPNNAEGLEVLLSGIDAPVGWNGPYLNEIPKDPWGNYYEYKLTLYPNVFFQLLSLGPDGIRSGDDVYGIERSKIKGN